jgi:hypothetical protein
MFHQKHIACRYEFRNDIIFHLLLVHVSFIHLFESLFPPIWNTWKAPLKLQMSLFLASTCTIWLHNFIAWNFLDSLLNRICHFLCIWTFFLQCFANPIDSFRMKFRIVKLHNDQLCIPLLSEWNEHSLTAFFRVRFY